MTTNRELVRGRRWRAFTPRSWVRPPGLALLGLALLGLLQAGCKSDGCSNCNLSSKISNGVQALASRVTKHFDNCGGGADCGCGGGAGYAGETVVDSGVPIISGGMVYPGQGTLVPPPTIEQPPSQLEPIPSTSTGASTNPGSTRSTPSGNNNNRLSYTTVTPKGNLAQRRGSEVSRAMISNQDPTNSSSTDLLDNLPPVDLPTEVTKAASPTVKPVPVATPTTSTTPTPTATPAPAAGLNPPAVPPASATNPAPVQDPITPTPAEKVSAVEGAIGIMPTIETPAAFMAPGIRRHASVAPSLAGGSAPSVEGLDWLKEKGCRTFIDLRKSSEVEANFVDAVNDRNMVYISLPIVANRLDSSRLARFDDLVSQSENRPIYFCDSDGTRAALVWYIHLRSVGQEDVQSATTKAEEIGLTEVQVNLAEAYLTTHKPRARAAAVTPARVASASLGLSDPESRPRPDAETTMVPARAASALPGGPDPAPSGLNPGGLPVPSTDPSPPMLPGEDRPQALRFRDPSFWRPVAVLVMTAIGVPLAYRSRSVFSVSKKARARASLTGSVLPPSELPLASGA